MGTIVEYTDQKPPENCYPLRIICPLTSSTCCVSNMEQIGRPETDRRSVFRYRVCRRCGYAVRVFEPQSQMRRREPNGPASGLRRGHDGSNAGSRMRNPEP